MCASILFCKEISKVINTCWVYSQICRGVCNNYNPLLFTTHFPWTLLFLGEQLSSSIMHVVSVSASSQISSANVTSRRPPTLQHCHDCWLTAMLNWITIYRSFLEVYPPLLLPPFHICTNFSASVYSTFLIVPPLKFLLSEVCRRRGWEFYFPSKIKHLPTYYFTWRRNLKIREV